MLNTESIPRGTGIENGSVKWNGLFSIGLAQLRKEVHLKGGLAFSKLFWLDRADPFSFQFRPIFLEILVEWIVPEIFPSKRAA